MNEEQAKQKLRQHAEGILAALDNLNPPKQDPGVTAEKERKDAAKKAKANEAFRNQAERIDKLRKSKQLKSY